MKVKCQVSDWHLCTAIFYIYNKMSLGWEGLGCQVSSGGVHCFAFELIEEEGILVLLHVLCGAGFIQEEGVYTLNVIDLHLGALSFPAHQAGRCDELDGIAQGGLEPNAGQHCVGVLTHLHIFLLTADAQNLLGILLTVG